MATSDFNKETTDFNKNLLDAGFEALNTISTQTAVAVDQILAASPAVPEEGKNVVTTCVKESQTTLVNFKKFLEAGLQLDVTSTDASAKSLEALEIFSNESFGQAAVLKNEAQTFIEAATKLLPNDAKAVVTFWNDTFNFGFDAFQSYVNDNFALAKKVTTDAFSFAPASLAIASK
ncbi:MAG: hypothetical protein PHI31_07650 [Desulfuromonadaceae bacterium]|nr:hypothetical protein [Desulfuromonadaceae bacterium]